MAPTSWQKSLQKNYVKLVEYLPGEILDYLHAEGIISKNELEKIRTIIRTASTEEGNKELYMVLSRCFDPQIQQFVKILKTEGGERGKQLAKLIEDTATGTGQTEPTTRPVQASDEAEDTQDQIALNQLASKFSTECQSIGTYLGIPYDRLQQIRKNNVIDSKQCNMDTLMEYWKTNRHKPRQERIRTLANALSESKRKDLSNDVPSLFKLPP